MSNPESPGWDAIDAALRPIYGGQEPRHYGTVVSFDLGGPDPIHGISAYWRDTPIPHWHFITYGYSELWTKQSDDPEWSGFGFEMTFRLQTGRRENGPAMWALSLLQNLARYVFQTGRIFDAGHTLNLNGPISLEVETSIRAAAFIEDPELGAIDSPNGKVRFVQLVGLTLDEYELIDQWSVNGFQTFLEEAYPLCVTALDRKSLLDEAITKTRILERVKTEGSSKGTVFCGSELSWLVDHQRLVVRLKATQVESLIRGIRGRVAFGRPFVLQGEPQSIVWEASGDAWAFAPEEAVVRVRLTTEMASWIEGHLVPVRGVYACGGTDGLRIEVTPAEIRDQSGEIVRVVG